MVLGLWFESVRAMFYYSKRASRPHAKTALVKHQFAVAILPQIRTLRNAESQSGYMI